MCEYSLHQLTTVKLPDGDANRQLACPFCQQRRSQQEWLARSFECNCSSYEWPANVLQTFDICDEGYPVARRIPEFWSLYDRAQGLREQAAKENIPSTRKQSLWHKVTEQIATFLGPLMHAFAAKQMAT